MKYSIKNNAILVAVSAMFSALLVGGKLALAVLPNIEVVTLIIAVCAYVWGLAVALPAVNVFIAVDMAIWGVNTWVISYLIHWNIVALCFWLLGKVQTDRKVLTVLFATVLAVVLSALFGVLTSAIDTMVGFTGEGFFVDFDNWLYRFAVMYVAGISFYITQIVCNLALFAVAFIPLVTVNRKAQFKLFPPCEKNDDSRAN